MPSAAAPMTGVHWGLWRAVAAFRLASCLFCVFIIFRYQDDYQRPLLGLLVAGAIIGWTGIATLLTLSGWANGWKFVLGEITVVAALTLMTIPVQTEAQSHGEYTTLTTVWAATPALSAGVLWGWRAGLAAGLFQGLVSVGIRESLDDGRTIANLTLLIMAGAVVGYVSELVLRAEHELASAAAERAALGERERLSRNIHDGVLQVLALVQRRGAEIGGEAAELGQLAGEQEVALRALITSRPGRDPNQIAGTADLALRLAELRASKVTVSVPATPVPLDSHAVDEIVAAVEAALDNAAQHAGDGAKAWVLLEDMGDELAVTVRDDGVGIPDGRLDEAREQGRLGVLGSIRGRIAALAGTTTITSGPGEGTEVELRVPLIRQRRQRGERK